MNSAISSDDQNIEYNKEIKKKSKYNKISLGLLVISLVMAFITQNPPLVLSSLLGLGLFFIIQFRVARCFLYIIFTISLSLLIKLLVKHQFFSPEDYIYNLLWVFFLTIGLLTAFYPFCCKEKGKTDKIILWIAIISSMLFNFFTNSSSPNYATEVEMVRQQESFVPSRDVIEIPSNRYLIIKSRNSGKICLFKIKRFNQKSFLFSSVLLKEVDKNKFTIDKSSKGEINFNISSIHNLFEGFKVVFLPVNSLVIYPHYSYGYMAQEPSFDNKRIINLPENEITWIPNQRSKRLSGKIMTLK